MLKIIDVEQGSPEWFAARAGIPTASEFHTVMAVGPKGGKSATRVDYLNKLAGEILTGEPMVNYVSPDMERGKIMESEARDLYAFMHGIEPQRVGFIRNGDKGASPDSLLGADGGLEIKSAAAHVQIKRLLADDLPSEHKAQVQGSLWVAEREWWDFVCYCPKLPLFVKRVYRDEEYIKSIALAVDAFNVELRQTVEFIRRYGTKSEAA
jgi:YqaJ-like recombinase protein